MTKERTDIQERAAIVEWMLMEADRAWAAADHGDDTAAEESLYRWQVLKIAAAQVSEGRHHD